MTFSLPSPLSLLKLPIVISDISGRTVGTGQTGRRKAVGYLQSVVELNPGQPETNPNRKLKQDLNPGQPHANPTTEPLGHTATRCLSLHSTQPKVKRRRYRRRCRFLCFNAVVVAQTPFFTSVPPIRDDFSCSILCKHCPTRTGWYNREIVAVAQMCSPFGDSVAQWLGKLP